MRMHPHVKRKKLAISVIFAASSRRKDIINT